MSSRQVSCCRRETPWAAHVAVLAMFFLLTTLQSRGEVRGEEQEPATAAASNDAQREKRLDEMRRRAEGLKVFVLIDGEKVVADSVSEPLMRYSDQPRAIRDATMWCWLHKGRPVALFKTQMQGGDESKWTWLDGLYSLSPELIEVEWADGHHFASRQPGLKFSGVPEGPEPADKPRGRLQQMKELAGRFEITILPSEGNKQEMRLLPRALYRYSAPNDGLLDGAVFGFTSNGTNPDAVLAIELARGADRGAWQYGLAQLTTGGLAARWDGREVWSATQKSITPTAFDEWTWFWAPGRAGETR